uniref:Uncharacterized protein n=1 Tax=Panagrolaimus sp. ES5 TaxID=591445 RepID=A0AC34FSS9_9BILA
MVANDDKKETEPIVTIIQPAETAATSIETKLYDFKIEPSHEVIEPQDIQVTTFQFAEAVSTKQNNNANPIIEEAKIIKSSEPPTEEINVVHHHDVIESQQQLSPSHKADLIPHENMEDKIHVPKDRPKSAASLEHDHKNETIIDNAEVEEDHEKPSLSKIQIPDKNSPDYNPMDDPHSPDYRPIIHQSSFEIPIVFEKKSTGEGPVRTGFTIDELPWEQDVSESAKSEDIKVIQEISTKDTVEEEDAKMEIIKDVESTANESTVENVDTDAKKEEPLKESEKNISKQPKNVEKQNDEKVEEKTSTVDVWQALEDIDEEPLELHVLEKIPEEPATGIQETPKSHESLHDKKHEEIQAEKPPPTEPPKIDEEVNIHFPLEKSFEESHDVKQTPPPTTKPNADSVVRTISESSPEQDEDTTYYSIANQNTVTADDDIDLEEEKKVVEEAVEVQKETERMISEDESISTSFYSVSEKLSSKSEEDREKTPAANEANKMYESKYENKIEHVADLIPHEKEKDKIHVPHDKEKPAAMLENEYENTSKYDKTNSHHRQIPVIIETKSTEIDGDDISVTVEDAAASDEEEAEEKPQIILRKDKQRQNSSEENNQKPIVAVAPTSRIYENEKQKQPKKEENNQVLIGVTRPTSVIRTDENDDSEAPLI